MAAIPYQCLACQTIFRSHREECPFDGAPLTILDEDALCGEVFADRYLIKECIGEGSMGRVYYAQNSSMNNYVAIRVLFGDYAADPAMCERFYRETETASSLAHPNVISVTDFGKTAQNHLYLVTRYIEGRMLDEVIATKAPLDAPTVRRILRQLCLGLDHAHSQGLIHHDFQSHNILFTGCLDTGVAQIADFGIALWSDIAPKRGLTGEDAIMGTPAFMSPEQAAGEPVDHRSDLYRLGLVLYQMLSGVLPFHGPAQELVQKHIRETPPTIREQVPDLEVDPQLEQIAMKLLAKRPEDRFQHAHEVLAALDDDVVPQDAGQKEHADEVQTERADEVQAVAEQAAEVQAASESVVPEEDAGQKEHADEVQAAEMQAAEVQAASESVVPEEDACQEPAAALKRARTSLSREVAGTSAVACIAIAVALLFLYGAHSAVPGPIPFSPSRSGEPMLTTSLVASYLPRTHAQIAYTGDTGAESSHVSGETGKQRNRDAEPDRNKRRSVGKKRTAAAQGQEMSFEAFRALYQEVGKELLRLNACCGLETTEPYLSKYAAIPLDDITHSQLLRLEAYEQLRILKRQLRREMRIAKAD